MSHIIWRGSRAAALVTASALLLAACAGGGPENSGEPVDGGEITIMSAGNVPSWDPLFTFGTLPGVNTDRLIAVYGELLEIDQDGEVQPGLAASFTTDDGGATWTLTLRDGVTFSDGTAYDADAVKFNWDRAADPDNAASMAHLAQSFTSTVEDEKTIRVVPESPNPVLDEQIAELMQLIASPTALEDGEYTEPVGAGPFVLVKQDPAVGEDFERNQDYALEAPRYDALHYRTVADPSQRVETIASGGAQLMNGFTADFLDYADDPRFDFYTVPNGGFREMAFNNARAPFDDVRARRAVALALDPTELVQTLLADPSQEGSTGLLSEDSPYADASARLPEQDFDEAQSLVDDLIADGVDMDIVIVPAAIPELTRAAEYVQLSLEKLDGVTVTIEQVDIQDWRTRTQSNDNFDLTFYPGIYDVNPPPTTLTNFFETDGTDNLQNSSSDEMERALADLREAEDEQEKADAVARIQELYARDVPVYVFGFDYRVFFHEADVSGFEAVGRGAILPENLFYTQ